MNEAWAFLADTHELEAWLKRVGVLISVFGAALTAPSATMNLLRSIFRRRHTNASADGIASTVKFGTSGILDLGGHGWEPGADLERKVEVLKILLDNHRTETKNKFEAVNNSVRKLTDELERVETAAQESDRQLHQRILKNEQHAERIQVMGLPVIAAGIFLSGIPEDLAVFPVVGWVFMLGGIVLTSLVYRLSLKRKLWRGQEDANPA